MPDGTHITIFAGMNGDDPISDSGVNGQVPGHSHLLAEPSERDHGGADDELSSTLPRDALINPTSSAYQKLRNGAENSNGAEEQDVTTNRSMLRPIESGSSRRRQPLVKREEGTVYDYVRQEPGRAPAEWPEVYPGGL